MHWTAMARLSSGLTIEATGNDAGLFITNNGIIKNLTLKDVTVKQVPGAAGAFADNKYRNDSELRH